MHVHDCKLHMSILLHEYMITDDTINFVSVYFFSSMNPGNFEHIIQVICYGFCKTIVWQNATMRNQLQHQDRRQHQVT